VVQTKLFNDKNETKTSKLCITIAFSSTFPLIFNKKFWGYSEEQGGGVCSTTPLQPIWHLTKNSPEVYIHYNPWRKEGGHESIHYGKGRSYQDPLSLIGLDLMLHNFHPSLKFNLDPEESKGEFKKLF